MEKVENIVLAISGFLTYLALICVYTFVLPFWLGFIATFATSIFSIVLINKKH